MAPEYIWHFSINHSAYSLKFLAKFIIDRVEINLFAGIRRSNFILKCSNIVNEFNDFSFSFWKSFLKVWDEFFNDLFLSLSFHLFLTLWGLINFKKFLCEIIVRISDSFHSKPILFNLDFFHLNLALATSTNVRIFNCIIFLPSDIHDGWVDLINCILKCIHSHT